SEPLAPFTMTACPAGSRTQWWSLCLGSARSTSSWPIQCCPHGDRDEGRARHDWSASYECPPKIMGDVPHDFGTACMADCLTKEKFMPERNVIGGMDRVGIMVLEDAFDAKPTYDPSDEATNRSQVSRGGAGPCAQ